MGLFYHSSPLLAIVVAQAEAGSPTGLAVYGPLGIICLWLMWRDERRAIQTDKTREAIDGVAHQMKGMNRNLLFFTASHGPAPLREIAKKELERTEV